MAKKTAGKRKTRGKGGKESAPFVLKVTNLKFIGAAIDTAIADLKLIKVTARDKPEVQATIEKLQAIYDETSEVCPQSWWCPFETT